LNKKKPKRGEILELRIDRMAFGGKGIGKLKTDLGDMVVFVPNTIPGQIVECSILKVRKNHLETRLMRVIQPSPDEVENEFQPIAGAPLAQLPIDIQERYKRDTSIDLMRRIGGVQNSEELFDEFISSPQPWHYRNKMEYSFAAIRYDLNTGEELDEFALGFKHRGTWWMVENLDKDSGLFDADLENNLHKIRSFCIHTGLPPWHAPRKEGFFRFLTVRKSYAHDEILLNLVTTSKDLDQFPMDAFVDLLQRILGRKFAGLIHTINDEIGDRVQSLSGQSRLIVGKNHITEELNGLRFDIEMASFFQTNPKCAERLYTKAISYLKEKIEPKGVVLDLFCGTGTIAQLVASQIPDIEVVGVDIVESAISDAQRAASINQINNTRFIAADAGKFLLENPEYKEGLSGIVLDPPRAGIAPKTLKRVIELNAPTIVYISCNPATLARDTNTLNQSGYKLEKFSLVDQFPHTSHIEAISLFTKQ
jgi:23S rRNA (uracil-5-)-methyltransferase RumA